MYRMMGALTGSGVTVMVTVELRDSFVELQFSPQGVAFLTDAIIMQRYVEIEGQLRRALSVVKVRSSAHSADLREYKITEDGLLVMDREMSDYRGLLTGSPRKVAAAARTKLRRQDGGRKRTS